MMKEQIIEEVCEWLGQTFTDDHTDATHGISCLFPDIILCDKYFTVKDLQNGLREHFKTPKNDPQKFESYGNHLRNLLGPYQTLIDLVEGTRDGKFNIDSFKDFIKSQDLQKGIDRIIEFSKTPEMEDLNWRENEN